MKETTATEVNGARPTYCKICEGSRVSHCCQKQGAAYYICHDCLTIYQYPPPEKSSMISYADEEYETGVYRDYVEARAMKLDHFRHRMEAIRRLTSGNPGCLLDIGCSCGYFMEVAAANGYEVEGVEFSQGAIEAASEGIRPKISQVDVEALSRSNAESYDLVTAFDLIEHLEEPIEFLKQVRGLLKPGGSIAISTPDTGHFSRRWMGSRWFMFQPMQHLCLFSSRSLSTALEKAGFQVIAVEPATKTLSIDYVMGQIRIYNPLISSTYRLLRPLLPTALISKYHRPNIGEVFAVATKAK